MGAIQNCKCKCKYNDNNKKETEVYFPNQENNNNGDFTFNNFNNINKSNSKLKILFNRGKKNEEKDEEEIIYKNQNNLINKISFETNLNQNNKSRNINNDIFKPEEQTTQTQRMTYSKRETKDLLSQNSNNCNKKRKYRKSVDYIYKTKNFLNESKINDIDSIYSKLTYNTNLYKIKSPMKSSSNLIHFISAKPKNWKKEYVSIKLYPRKDNKYHNNDNLNEIKNNNNLDEDPILNNITCKKFFNKYHLVYINSMIEYDDVNSLIECIKLVNDFMDDSFFYSELNKIKFLGSILITKQILKRFCSSTKTEFRIYNSKEKFITLQNPMKVIKYKDIKKACYVEFKKMNSNLKNGLESERNEKKDFFYFLIYLKNGKFEIFSSENKNNIIKWVSIINFFISKQDDYV